MHFLEVEVEVEVDLVVVNLLPVKFRQTYVY